MIEAPHPHDAGPPLHLGGGALTDRLVAFLGEARANEAARARAREQWLRRAAEDEGTLRGALVDVAERATPLVVTTVAGRSHRDRVRAVGADFCVVSRAGPDAEGNDALLALGAVSCVRVGRGSLVGDRAVTGERSLAEAMAELAAERPHVLLVTRHGEPVHGELRTVGQDLCTLLQPGPARARVLVAIDAIAELVLA